jgi:large subunit ribosomal protein L15
MPFTLDELRPNPGSNRDRKRVGRGHGSGTGKTSGKGQKGQKSRSGPGVRPGFEGGQLPLQQKLPYKRGFTNIHKTRWEVVNLRDLARVDAAEVTPDTLIASGLVRGTEFPVKVLGDGQVGSGLTLRVHAISDAAREAVTAAGGSVELLDRTDKWVSARPRTRRLQLNRELKDAGVGKVDGPSRSEALAARGTSRSAVSPTVGVVRRPAPAADAPEGDAAE